MITIYKIYKKDNPTECYIGQTKHSIEVRLYQHWADRNKKVACGISKLMRLSTRDDFKIETLETCEKEIARQREQYWIDKEGKLNIQNAVKDKDYDKNYAKQYRQLHPRNKEKHNQNEKAFYQRHKQEILEKNKEKVVCECGLEINKRHITRHTNSQTHKFIINQTVSLSEQDSAQNSECHPIRDV